MDVRNFYGKSSTKQKNRRVRAKVPVEAAVKQMVKRELDRRIEDKFSGGIVENSNAHNASISAADMYPVLPVVAPGTAYNQRTGDKIRPKSLIVDAAISFNDYGQGYAPEPMYVKVWILQHKGQRSYPLGSVPINSLLDAGAGSTSWDGSTMNSLFPVNKDEFQVLGQRTFTIMDHTAEEGVHESKRIQIKVRGVPKTLTYDSAGAPNYPTNFAPFMVVGWARSDGTTPLFTDVALKVTSWTRLTYEDA